MFYIVYKCRRRLCCSVFLRAVYTLGESSVSSTIVFRTSSRGADGDCLSVDAINNDASGASSKPRCCGDSVALQSAATHSGSSSVTVTGDDEGQIFSSCQLSTESDLQPVRTHEPRTGTSLEQIVTVAGPPLTSPLNCFQTDGSVHTVPSTKVEAKGSNVAGDGMAVEIRSHMEEEPKFVPKPPEESAVPRRNSFSRHGSIRRRVDSGSSQPSELKLSNEADQKLSALNVVSPRDSFVAESGEQTAENASSMSVNDPAACHGGLSEASPTTQSSSKSSPEDLARCRSLEPDHSQRRSSSLGALMRRLHHTRDRTAITDKLPARRRDRPADCDSPAHITDDTRRKHSDISDSEAVLKNSNSSSVSRIPLPKQDICSVRQKKKLFTHKR